MFRKFLQWIQALFGKIPSDRVGRDLLEAEEHRRRFEDTSNINFDSIFGDSLAKKATSDSDIEITGTNGNESRRSDFIARVLATTWARIRETTTSALGKGGMFLVPSIINGEIFVNEISQDRGAINELNGNGDIISLTLTAEVRERGSNAYKRLVDYTLDNGTLTIRTKAVGEDSGSPVSLDIFPDWATITPEITISGVDRVPVAFLKCPKSNRKDDSRYGVPITYGAEDLVRQLRDCMAQIEAEFTLKRPFVGADETLLGKENKLPSSGLFKIIQAQGALRDGPFWEVFDPDIRDSSYYNRWMQLCYQMEKSVGTSRGILTEPITAAATATEIKAANYDTFCMVADIRKALEKCFEDLAYAVDVLAERFGLTPAGARGDYSVTYNWDMSLLESSQETFTQLSELESRGLIQGARLAAWVTGDTIAEAQAEIDLIRATSPPVDALLGEA